MDDKQTESIGNNIEKVLDRIQKTAAAAGRDPENISLIAVTKQKSAAVIKTLAEFGIKDIGESYLKEALFKIELLKDFGIQWHMIGNIQRGKEKEIAAKFSEVHSLDSTKIAFNLNKYARMNQRDLPVYLEFNISGEETKQGWEAWRDDQWAGLLPEIEEVLDLSNLKVRGLMTMAPYSSDSQAARPYFKRLRELRDYLSREFPAEDFRELSMGMSGDFEVAIQEGATVLRIGSALVGSR
jgi:pyridoxal phosphate enzyme (YggS family)